MSEGAQFFFPIHTHDERGTVLLISVDFVDFVEGNIEVEHAAMTDFDPLEVEVQPGGRQTIKAQFVFQRITVRNTPPRLWECVRHWWAMRKMWREDR